MASIAKRSDGRWRARYRDAAGVEHSRHFTRKVEAQRWLDTVTTALTSGMYTDPRRSRITDRGVRLGGPLVSNEGRPEGNYSTRL
jgi:hypothetical protein